MFKFQLNRRAKKSQLKVKLSCLNQIAWCSRIAKRFVPH